MSETMKLLLEKANLVVEFLNAYPAIAAGVSILD
jgi:hypothetical protein